MSITTLAEMKQYIAVELGAPINHIELTDLQLNHIIEDSLQIFQKYHTGEGNYEEYLLVSVSAGVSGYDMPPDIESVTDIHLGNSTKTNGINVLFSPQHMLMTGGYKGYVSWDGIGSGSSSSSSWSLTSYEITMQYLDQINETFDRRYYATYLKGSHKMILVPTPDKDGTVLIRTFRKQAAEFIYNDDLFKRLATAKAKILWATNLKKFNIVLPTGATVNAQELMAEGKEELTLVLDDIKAESEPPIFMIA